MNQQNDYKLFRLICPSPKAASELLPMKNYITCDNIWNIYIFLKSNGFSISVLRNVGPLKSGTQLKLFLINEYD
jgi:hypothetical protein